MLVGVEEGKSKQRARARNRMNGIRRTKTRKDDGSARDVEKEGQRKVVEERVGEKQVRKERPAVSSCDVTQVPHGRLGERRWAGGQCSCTLLYSYLDPVFHQVYLASACLSFVFFLPDLSISFSDSCDISKETTITIVRSFTRAVMKALLKARSS